MKQWTNCECVWAVYGCVCACVSEHAHFSQECSWLEAGPVTRGDGRRRGGGSEWWCSRSKNSTASIPLLPPNASLHLSPPQSLHLFLYLFIIPLLNENGCRYLEGGLRCSCAPPRILHFMERRVHAAKDQRGTRATEEVPGKQKDCACLLSNWSSLISRHRLQIPAHVSSLRGGESYLHWICL